MKDRPLFSITEVLDADTGLYEVSLCDFGIHCGSVDSFLRKHGEAGMAQIEKEAAYVLRRLREDYLPVALRSSASQDKESGQ